MTKQPTFVNLSGATARVDSQKAPAAYLRLTIVTEAAHDDAGHLVDRGQVAEVWIRPEEADALAAALWAARFEE